MKHTYRYIGSGVMYLGGAHRTQGDVFVADSEEIPEGNERELEVIDHEVTILGRLTKRIQSFRS